MPLSPDSIVEINANNVLMTYAVVVSEDDGPEHVGRLEFERDCLRLSAGSPVRYDDLRDVYVERRSGGSTAQSRPTLVLITRQGERLRIGSLEGLGALHELAGKVAEARGKAAA
jgi:hypothetical protein